MAATWKLRYRDVKLQIKIADDDFNNLVESDHKNIKEGKPKHSKIQLVLLDKCNRAIKNILFS